MHKIKLTTLGALIAAITIGQVQAAEPVTPGEGTLFRSLFGEQLQRDYGIRASVLLDLGYTWNNRTDSDGRNDGSQNNPITTFSDDGPSFNALHVFIDKPLKARVVPRVTPLPGPKEEAADLGFIFESNYGRGAQGARTFGWDMGWDINEQDAAKAAADEDYFLAFPNFAATAYLPYGTGYAFMAGVFGSGIGYEIPPNIRAGRGAFASKPYAFIAGPGTVAGVLGSTRLYSGENGHFGVDLGIVQGWENVRDNNDDKSLMGALRWRSTDMKTWVDYEFIIGNEQNDEASDLQLPTSRVLSQDDQFKQYHTLNGWHQFDERWAMGAEVLYGHQEGDGKATTRLLGGRNAQANFDGASWWGANATATYKLRPDLAFSVRGEYFSDPDGFVQFPTTYGAEGDYKAITAGFRYDLNGHISIRPELRYDWFDPRNNDHPYGNGQNDSRLGAIVETLFYF